MTELSVILYVILYLYRTIESRVRCIGIVQRMIDDILNDLEDLEKVVIKKKRTCFINFSEQTTKLV